jgi:hypothetical protein
MCAFPKQIDTVDIIVINLYATCLKILLSSRLKIKMSKLKHLIQKSNK